MTEPTEEPGELVRLRLDLGYDGTHFSGWARQPGRRTVQDTVETGLGTVLRLPAPPRITCAGRTDAGVHARGQVGHADVPADSFARAPGRSDRTPPVAVRDRLAGVLPDDVRVHRVAVAPEGFDARFSAVWRRYAYQVCDDPERLDPLRRHEVLYHPRCLDLSAMNEAAVALLGEHDYAAYCRRRDGATTVRTLRELCWERDDAGFAVARVVADAFCHSMVRSLVGALLAVGDGRQDTDWPGRVLAARTRDSGVNVVGALGLTLEEVGYPPDDALAERARQARRRRALPVAHHTEQPTEPNHQPAEPTE